MSEYLTKEEIRQWRSSIEKCTLEEYAARLGKKIQDEKETNDIADIVKVYNSADYDAQANMKIDRIPAETPSIIKINSSSSSTSKETPKAKVEPVKETPKPQTSKKSEPKKEEVKPEIKKVDKKEEVQKETPKETKKAAPLKAVSNIKIKLKKALTEREQLILEHFQKNPGRTVFAQELADILNLKKNYIYKYIKNLREKVVDDILENSEKGGFKYNG